MKAICSFFVVLLFREAISGIVRKPPAFSTPVYSDSYLPAAMQVIFHAVDQLKHLEAEQALHNKTITNSSSTASPMLHTTQSVGTTVPHATTVTLESTKPNEGKIENSAASKDTVSSSQIIETSSSSHQESPEINAETPEANYATPETNYESPEVEHGVQEANEEVPEENEEDTFVPLQVQIAPSAATNLTLLNDPESPSTSTSTLKDSVTVTESEKKKEPTVDGIVEEIYEIMKPTPSEFIDESADNLGESKSTSGMSIEKMESLEEEEEETRFTLLGEKVSQVPRPSLTSYLRRAKVPTSPSLQQLANLYDLLSKDARKQGFGKYTGYSDEVLKTLESSAEGGIGPQMKQILEKVLERNELTRQDARAKASQTVRHLKEPTSTLHKDLRPLLPLRYSP